MKALACHPFRYRISDTINSYADESPAVNNPVNHTSTMPSITSLPIQINATQPIVTASKPPITENIMSQLLPDQTESLYGTEQIVELPAPVNSTGDNKPSSDNSGMRQKLRRIPEFKGVYRRRLRNRQPYCEP